MRRPFVLAAVLLMCASSLLAQQADPRLVSAARTLVATVDDLAARLAGAGLDLADLKARVAALEKLLVPAPAPEPTPTPIPAPEPTPPPVVIQPPQSGDGNVYYAALCARPDVLKCYGLRTQAQLATYADAPKGTLWVNYDADVDAARVVIPPFHPTPWTALAQAITETDTVLTLTGWHDSFVMGRALLIENEVVRFTALNQTAKQVTVRRAQAGTVATAHAAGAGARPNNNSLLNQVRLPMPTTAGHNYLITWDVYYAESMVNAGTGFKAFQLSQAQNDSPYLEAQQRAEGVYATGKREFTTRKDANGNLIPVGFDPRADISSVTWRTYGGLNADPSLPMVGGFVLKPNRWVRYWVRMSLAASGSAHTFDAWVADSETAPVQLIANGVLRGPTIGKFWIEMNTSNDRLAISDRRDRVAYVRNVVALRDPQGPIEALLAQPD